jgi:hypothetical protein
LETVDQAQDALRVLQGSEIDDHRVTLSLYSNEQY